MAIKIDKSFERGFLMEKNRKDSSKSFPFRGASILGKSSPEGEASELAIFTSDKHPIFEKQPDTRRRGYRDKIILLYL